jgi:hypothetical protein
MLPSLEVEWNDMVVIQYQTYQSLLFRLSAASGRETL